jgi:hypothetical protein
MAHATIDLTDRARLRGPSLPRPEDLRHNPRFETCSEQCFKDVADSSRKQGLTRVSSSSLVALMWKITTRGFTLQEVLIMAAMNVACP